MTSLKGYIQGLGSGADRIVKKTGKEIKLSVYDNIDRVIVFNEAGETSQSGTPTPSDPVDIVGIGTKQLDDTYSVSIDYDDGDGRTGTITASGLAYPLYEGDILDFVNGKVIRANGIYTFDGTEGWEYITSWADDGFRLASSNFTNKVTNAKVGGDYRISLYKYVGNTYTAWNFITAQGNNVIGTLSNLAGIVIRNDSITDSTTFKNSLIGIDLVYSLNTSIDEYITLSGDISDIGTATVTADGTLTVKYDKVEMAIRKYSNPPAWGKIGYSETPNEIINGFNYAKEIMNTYTSSSFYTNDKNLMFWPDIDITGRSNYNAFFDRSNLIHTPPLTLGISGTNPTLTRAFRETRIEDIEISTIESNSYSISCSNTFIGCANLKTAKINCEVGALEYMFSGCTSLTTVNDFTHSISSVVTASETFRNCSSLITAPTITNFGSITAMNNFFNGCTLLENIPIYDTSAITSWSSAFANCNSLTDTSLDNILVMCINATSYNGTKKLSTLGISNTYDTRIASLPHYNDFLTAGWIIR